MQAAALRRGVGNAARPWQCRACGAAMAAVTCGAGRFRMSPHFRAIERHAQDCDANGTETLPVAGKVVSEQFIHEEQIVDHLVDWVSVSDPGRKG